MKNFIKENWFKLFIVLVIIVIVGVYSYQTIKPKTNQDKVNDCLKLSSDFGAEMCLELLLKQEVKQQIEQ
ncbi:MAG: hypothetical protein COU29_00170 [Candidatus Magasanikbacteria bacterium CG10_big_fil_rev_8_21_14_0_10_36_32]|uniref:Uncharacterized protein n=1 Tax=Candidatus Magasanikbacteria bacterium CG10_big_fil_rev_8_21_14_0_10_36_32 TaxID=1974646 RepID=A0A2M6W7M4_9BACT|nr:MAG: hypothetical protein COU29_00170 [Candidatus Magasanikbacteria bacterium CG10_big_fil_rev_8_21_14_0_10_36_32]